MRKGEAHKYLTQMSELVTKGQDVVGIVCRRRKQYATGRAGEKPKVSLQSRLNRRYIVDRCGIVTSEMQSRLQNVQDAYIVKNVAQRYVPLKLHSDLAIGSDALVHHIDSTSTPRRH